MNDTSPSITLLGEEPNFAWFILPAIAAAVAVPSASYADAFPVASFTINVQGEPTIFTAGTVSNTACNSVGCAFSTVTATYNGGVATISGSGTSSGGVDSPDSYVTASLEYAFEVEGSFPGVLSVPVILAGSGEVTQTGYGGADVGFTLPSTGLGACITSGYPVACGSETPSVSGSVEFDAAPNTIYGAQFGLTGVSEYGVSSWGASVDPQLEIDPLSPYAGDFTLVVSPSAPTGIG